MEPLTAKQAREISDKKRNDDDIKNILTVIYRHISKAANEGGTK